MSSNFQVFRNKSIPHVTFVVCTSVMSHPMFKYSNVYNCISRGRQKELRSYQNVLYMCFDYTILLYILMMKLYICNDILVAGQPRKTRSCHFQPLR